MRFLQRERQAGMAGDNHGAETQENATAAQNQSEQETTQDRVPNVGVRAPLKRGVATA